MALHCCLEKIALVLYGFFILRGRNYIFMARITTKVTNLGYKQKIESLEQEKMILDEKITACGRALPSFNDNFRTAMNFLSNPHKLWASGDLEQQRNVLRLCFGEKLVFDKNEGFRTVSKVLPIRVLEGLGNPKSCIVEQLC